MDNYMKINGKKIEISQETADNFQKAFGGVNVGIIGEIRKSPSKFLVLDGNFRWGDMMSGTDYRLVEGLDFKMGWNYRSHDNNLFVLLTGAGYLMVIRRKREDN